jgi:CheY-like chemotaxis protein
MRTDRAILLVEDNSDDVFLMKRALAEAGVTNPLYVVEDGQQAVDYLAGAGAFSDRSLHPLPSLVFLDLNLPFKSGHDVLTWIRNQQHLEALVIVVLTSSEHPTDINKSYRLGANSYLVKPPTAAELVQLAIAFKWYWLKYNEFEPFTQ